MLPIVLFLICSLALVVTENKTSIPNKNNGWVVLCIILMAAMSGFRNQGGSDFETYHGLYVQTPAFPEAFDHNLLNENYEEGYLYLVAFYKTIGFSYYGYLLINAIFFYLCLWFGLKRYTNHFGFVLLVFLYKLFYYNTFISMRQSVTIALFFLMIPMLEDKKFFRYYFLCWLASRFHNGAYLLFLLYPLVWFKLTKQRLIVLNVLFIPTVFLSSLSADLLSIVGNELMSYSESDMEMRKVEGYFMTDGLSPISIFHTFEYFLLMTIVVLFFDEIVRCDNHADFILRIFVVLLPLFTMFRSSEILTREKDYFTITYAFILGYLSNIRCGKYKSVITPIAIIWCGFGFIRFVLLFDNGEFLRYDSWLSISDVSFFL